jgi:hypothetical protein
MLVCFYLGPWDTDWPRGFRPESLGLLPSAVVKSIDVDGLERNVKEDKTGGDAARCAVPGAQPSKYLGMKDENP